MELGTIQSSTLSAPAARVTPADLARQADAVFQGAAGVDAFLNTGGDRAAFYEAARSAEQQPDVGGDAFLSMLAALLKQGIVGSEQLEVRGETYTSFLENRIAAPDDIAHARRARLDVWG
ncbi:MAG: hypothetical protein GC168_20105 [Candidatus Hydrogenedens sp.]|nr:hypothetical protein [Candidatus Hydrogenedens sp.]